MGAAPGRQEGEDKEGWEGRLSQSQDGCAVCPLPEAFHVDMDSGLVTTKRPLQSYERFNLTVVATDGGQPPLWGTTMLLVEVIDVNDNRPVFVRPPNGTVLHIREVLLSPGSPASLPVPSPPHPPAVMPGTVQGSRCDSGETEAREGGRLAPCHTGVSTREWVGVGAVLAQGPGPVTTSQ